MNTIAASAPQFGLRPSDGWLCGTIAEMKITFGVMNKVAYLLNWGGNIGAETSPILGGYCGGPEGTAVVNTAYIIVGLLVHQGNYQLTFPIHFRYGCSTSKDVLWAVSVSCQTASPHALQYQYNDPKIELASAANSPTLGQYEMVATLNETR